MAERESRHRRSPWAKRLKWLRKSYANAAEMIRLGRLTAPHRTQYEVVHADRIYSLRRYHGIEREEGEGVQAPILLIPPLMVTSEIYDMSPDVSAISYLLGQGVDVWLVDFGVPETVEGGMTRTLDDHVRAVSDALDRVGDATGQDVHLAGYSQGGMFCYQAAAYRQTEGIASLITFGSPVDIYRNLPVPVSEQVAEKVIEGLRTVIERPLAELEGLPGFLTSIGFKMVSPRKELQQVAEFVGKLHDRKALEKREARRRFLGGEGFVAWPGPALRTFVDEFIVANRMASGGFVIDGRTVSLADVTCPILFFVGLNDDIARPAAVRAIRSAAFNAEVHELGIPAGHLGLVVGSRALGLTWPTVVGWLRWGEGQGELPEALREPERRPIHDVDDTAFDELDLDVEDFYGFATDALEEAFERLGRLGEDLSETVDALRWQLPRLSRLRKIRGDTRISLGLALSEKAEEMPDATFFLWKGRAFSYADANGRVDAIVRGLVESGVAPGDRVGVLMLGRPTYLSIVTALNRLGATAVLLSPDMKRIGLERALRAGEVKHLICDPANAARGREAFDGPVLALGGPYGEDRAVPDGVVDMEAIDPAKVRLPTWYEPNPGRAADEAMVLFTAGRAEEPRAAKITNRRWAFSALGAAAGCTLAPTDTVYCVLPLHHAAGMLVAVGGALVGGSRLALGARFRPEHFWSEARRYGATVVFYAGEMLRALVDAPTDPADEHNPVRLFAGSGMRRDVWERLRQRFKVGVLEFYASTEGNAVLANASGTKVGALGQPLPGATDMSIVAWDFRAEDFVRDEQGFLQRCGVDRPGILVARVDGAHPMAGFDGYVDEASTRARVLTDVFEAGDRWFSSGDLLRQDADGDYWFVDRLADVVRTAGGPVFTREVEDTLYRRPDVKMIAVHARDADDGEEVVATVVPRDGALDLDRLADLVDEKLEPRQRPRWIRVVDEIPVTDGYRPLKRALREQGLEGARAVYERGDDGRYRPIPDTSAAVSPRAE
ncbi:MAG TPA: alpha/beta fold hydrolase [Sandaracinaceae bacterium LLY-WYZ-13_1]|nr:alpha/beta fold hydrolase [Sandaracinaceae bacterium LLY-WYZ-13_1]